MSTPSQTEPEFSRPIRPSELGEKGLTLELEADAAERGGLAERYGLVELSALRATARVKWMRGGKLLKLAGRLHAEVVQTCVVTLEPVRNRIDEEFEVLYRPAGAAPEDAGKAQDEDGDADAEPLEADSLDVAEAVAVELALAIDPYPRKSGASLKIGPSAAENGPFPEPGADAEADTDKPFEGLAALRGNK
jgi:uncharacterized metal-binding protein YceD (DUF177 family)